MGDWRDLLAILGAASALLLAVAGFLALVRLAPADYI
jgi:hypothetical protein